MLRRIMMLVSGTGSLLLLLAIWSTLAVQARSQQTALIAPDIEALSLVNQIGGSVFATAKLGDYVYVGMGPRLLIVDVQDPAQPVVLGQTEVLSGVVSRIQIAGNYAYLGVDGGVSIVDASNPAAPTQVSFYDTPGAVYGIAISDTLAYIAEGRVWDGSQFQGGGLRILDVSNPTTPSQTGYLDTDAYAFGVSLRGNYAYLSNGSGVPGIIVVDISNPALPTQVNFFDTYVPPWGTFVSGEYLYVSAQSLGIGIYSLANPQNPISVTYFSTPGNAYDMTVNDDRAYVSQSTAGLSILDMTNPVSPALLGVYDLPYADVHNVSADDNYAYVAHGFEGLVILDVSDGTMPVEESTYDLFGYLYDVEVEGDYAYVLDYQEGIQVLDLTANVDPIVIGSYVQGGTDLEVAGNYAYITHNAALIVVDVTDPTSPTFAAQHPLLSGAGDLTIVGDIAYIAVGNGLQIVDISNPVMPLDLGSVIDIRGRHVAVANDFAYLAGSYDHTMYVIDVTDPVTPALVATYVVTNFVYGLDASGDYVYLAQNGLGLHVVDVTMPTSPTKAATYPLGWFADIGDIEVVDGRAYMASWTKGLAMFDVSDPTTPVLIDTYDSAGSAEDVAVTDNYVYVADVRGGLLILGDGGVELPTLSVNDASVLEGDEGTAILTFTVTLNSSEPVTQVVTVDYATADGTAVAHQDYHPISGTLTFTPGETVQTVSVLVVGDTAVETDETFYLNLSNPTNATLLRQQAVGTILNNDSETEINYPLYLPLLLKP